MESGLRERFEKILKEQTMAIKIWPAEDTVGGLLKAVCEEEGHADFEIEHGGDENTDPYCELLCERCGRKE